MSVSNLKELIAEAESDHRAVGAFSVGNMEMIIGVIKAAEELNTPVILQIAQARLKHSPLHMIGPMMVSAAKNAKIPVAVHLDHGLTLDVIKQALDLNFTSVMFDGSQYDVKQNLELTKTVVDLARKKGACIEAELGVIGGDEGNGTSQTQYTNPETARWFSESVNIDALAVAIGNAHGHYASAPKLRLDILKKIHQTVKIPLVLHGGTGISPKDFRECINFGISKINIATANLDSLTNGAKKYFTTTQGPHNYFSLNEAMVAGVYQNTKKYIQIFNNQIPLEQIS
jgi:fructose-bisphosphate aldolase, class II